jgi:hypothetical protein
VAVNSLPSIGHVAASSYVVSAFASLVAIPRLAAMEMTARVVLTGRGAERFDNVIFGDDMILFLSLEYGSAMSGEVPAIADQAALCLVVADIKVGKRP